MTSPLISTYRNPPFKPPTRLHSPNTPRSPKRKRSSEGNRFPSLQIDTALAKDESATLPGTQSPRMKVAQQLNDLQIDPIRPSDVERRRRPLTPPLRKRVKRASNLSPAGRLSPEVRVCTEADLKGASDGGDVVVDETLFEIGETPGCHHRNSSPNDNGELLQKGSKDEVLDDPLDEATDPTAPKTSPSLSPAPEELAEPMFPDRSTSPLPTQEDPTSDQAAFTWREEEITGHEIDASGDDDGEGINGVGFRPTPAIAYARKQRRRQQINEWKTREAREARQRRFEKRRGAEVPSLGGKALLDHEALKRSVRFVGVD